MTNPLNYIEKYPDRTKQIIGIDRQQWLSLLEITKDESDINLFRNQQKKFKQNQQFAGDKGYSYSFIFLRGCLEIRRV